MKSVLRGAVFVALSLSPALAASTPIRSLMTGSGGQLSVDDGLFIVGKRTSAGTALNLGVGSLETTGGRLRGITVFAFKEHLTTSELDLYATNVNRVARTCFNISPERAGAVTGWLGRQNQAAIRNVTQSFGPLKVHFVRDITSSGAYFTAVYLRRTGTPGVAPWTSYCTE